MTSSEHGAHLPPVFGILLPADRSGLRAILLGARKLDETPLTGRSACLGVVKGAPSITNGRIGSVVLRVGACQGVPPGAALGFFRLRPARDCWRSKHHGLTTAAVDEGTGERCRFRSSTVPSWCCTSPKVAEVLPLMYLHGMSSGDFVPTREEFLGSAAGLSSSAITRLTHQWQAGRDALMRRDLARVDYVNVWVDGIHSTSARRGTPVHPGRRGCPGRRHQGASRHQ
jgi:hypothetical protein